MHNVQKAESHRPASNLTDPYGQDGPHTPKRPMPRSLRNEFCTIRPSAVLPKAIKGVFMAHAIPPELIRGTYTSHLVDSIVVKSAGTHWFHSKVSLQQASLSVHHCQSPAISHPLDWTQRPILLKQLAPARIWQSPSKLARACAIAFHWMLSPAETPYSCKQ